MINIHFNKYKIKTINWLAKTKSLETLPIILTFKTKYQTGSLGLNSFIECHLIKFMKLVDMKETLKGRKVFNR